MTDAVHKEHCNLYYLFATDKKEHPMPQHKLDAIRTALFSHAPPEPKRPS